MNTVPLGGGPGAPVADAALTNSGVRRYAGLPEGGLPESGAREAGRRLATHPLLTARSAKGDGAVPDVLRDAHYLLSGIGVHVDVLRTRPGCAVLRAIPDPGISPVAACELVQGLLESVTEAASGVRGTLVETTCAAKGSAACLFTLMWETDDAAPMPPPNATVHAAAPTAAPPTAYRYLGQVASAPQMVATAPNQVPTEPPSIPPPTVSPPPPAPRVAAPAVTAPPVTVPPVPVSPIVPPAVTAAPIAPPAVAVPAAPTPALPVAPPTPVAVPVTVVTNEPRFAPPTQHAIVARSTRRKIPTWLFRRSWLLVLALVAGTAGGFLAAKSSSTSYSATATLVVQSGAGKAGPGSANDAQALATTYAALIPKDQAILQLAATALHTSTGAVSSHLSVSVEMGTSLLLVKYSSPVAQQAVAGSTLLARTVASAAPPTLAIASGSLVIVQLPNGAVAGGALHKYGAPIGGIFGLLLGIVLVLAAERADPRIDDTYTLGEAAGCPAASVPEDLSLPELVRALSRTVSGTTLTVVPFSGPDGASAMALARRLASTLPASSIGSSVAVSPSFSSGAVELSRGHGPTILVLRTGRRRRDVAAAAERLRLMGRAPVWAVLVGRRTDQDVASYDR
jgi:capsular polysaccharide biosynthesis protein